MICSVINFDKINIFNWRKLFFTWNHGFVIFETLRRSGFGASFKTVPLILLWKLDICFLFCLWNTIDISDILLPTVSDLESGTTLWPIVLWIFWYSVKCVASFTLFLLRFSQNVVLFWGCFCNFLKKLNKYLGGVTHIVSE